jgi:hypothetical protein
MLSRRATRGFVTSLLLTAAGVAVGVLWAARRQPVSHPSTSSAQQRPVVRLIPPSRSSFDDEPQLTAAPHDSAYRVPGADDYESLAPDELSAAFLARATESSSEALADELDGAAELDGFQIATIEDLTVPPLSDDPADFEIPSARRRVPSV